MSFSLYNSARIRMQKPLLRPILALSFYCLALASVVSAQTWVGIGPTGSYIRVVTVDPITPRNVYAALVYDDGHPLWGVYKSIDGGNSWSAPNTGLPTNSSVYSLAIHPSNTSVLYAGLFGGGLYKSGDSGVTWNAITNGLRTDVSIMGIAIDPKTTTNLYVATAGAGVYKSTDGGNTWKQTNTGLPASTVNAIAIDPGTPSTLYVAVTSIGVYKSVDSGATWAAASSGMTANSEIHAIAINPVTPSTLYAAPDAVGGVADGTVYVSNNGGATWTGASGIPGGLGLHTVAVDPVTPSNVYAGVFGAGVYLSTDGGNTFNSVSNGLTDLLVHSIAFALTTPVTVYAGTCNTGVFVEQSGSGSSVNVAVRPSIIAGGYPVIGTVTLNTTTGGTVMLASNNTNVAAVPNSVNVPSGSTTANFGITTSAVTSPTVVSISATYGSSVQSINLLVTPAVSSVVMNPTPVVGGNTTAGTVNLSGAAPSYSSVTLSSSNSAVASVPASIPVATGTSSATFPVTTGGVASQQQVTITATFNGSSGSVILTVNPASVSALALNPTSAMGGTSSTGTVTLNGAAPAGGAVIALMSGNTAAATVPSTVTVGAGATQANFPITTLTTSSTTSSLITATYNGQSASATLTITSSGVVGWYAPSWTYRKAIRINHAMVSGASGLTNFPVLISVTDPNLESVAFGGQVAQSNGNDILFTASDGVSKLNHELEAYTASTGTLVAWVQVPAVSPTSDTTIYIYYGNAGAANQQNPTGVWDTNYKGVWHFGGASGLSASDSTADGYNGTIGNAVAGAGGIGGAGSFNGSNAAITINAPAATNTASATISFWIKPTSVTASKAFYGTYSSDINNTGTRMFLDMGEPYCGGSANVRFILGGAACTKSNILSAGSWTYVTIAFDGTQASNTTKVKIYSNGAAQTVYDGGQTIRSSINLVDLHDLIGGFNNQYFSGLIDEWRLSNSIRSAGWIATEYNNQSSPSTFVTLGTQE